MKNFNYKRNKKTNNFVGSKDIELIKKVNLKQKMLNFLAFLLIFSSTLLIFSGCTSGQVSLFFTAYPQKFAYEIGEEVNYEGLKIESLNTDGTTTVQCVNREDIGSVDTSSSGEKIVKIIKGEISTTFSIYVADYVVSSKYNLKSTIKNATNGSIIYIKSGEYLPDNIEDESLYNIVIDKSLTLIGDGSSKTILHGNLLVGATQSGDNFIGINNFENVKIINIGFKLNSMLNNSYLTYEGPYGNYDLYGAIQTYNSSKLLINNCSFFGYSYGLNCDTISNLTLMNNSFRDIKINAVKVSNNITNSSIVKNVFMDIGSSSIVLDGDKQGNVGALYLSFASKGNLGVVISKNTFTRIGLINGELIYSNAGADELKSNENIKLTNGSYVNNSAIIFLVSSATNNLDAGGIVLTSNNYGKTLENISFGTNNDNLINQSGVYIYES